ncbi:hypothetical protein BKA93DRAFT_462463 [Sparassis latifolia]
MASSTNPLNIPPTPPITTSNTPTPTSVTPSPSASFSFTTPVNLTSCKSGFVGWNYSGPADSLSLYVLNGLIIENGTTNLNQSIATALDPTTLLYIWSPVNVAAGGYVLAAEVAGISAQSSEFFVASGTNSSCLASVSTPGPSADVSSSNHHVGAIVGGVIGGVAFVVVVLLILFFLYRRRRPGPILPRTRALSDAGAKKEGRWTGLSSRDTVNGDLPAKRSHDSVSHSEHSEETAVEQYSSEDIAEAKLGSPYKRESIETVPPLPYTESRRSSLASPVSPTSPRRSGSYGRGRARSQSQVMALTDFGADRAARHVSRRSVDSSILVHSPDALQGPVELPSIHSPADVVPINRSSSAGIPRRATRKPVPTYMEDGPVDNDHAPGSSGLWENDGSRSHSREDLAAAGINLPKLDHKSSFGEMKPMHVLIPDMPPPPRD